MIGDIRCDNTESLTTKLRQDGIEAMAVSIDVSNEEQAQTAVESIQKAYGTIGYFD